MRAMSGEDRKTLEILHRIQEVCEAPRGTVWNGLKKLNQTLERPPSIIEWALYIIDHGSAEKTRQKQFLKENLEKHCPA